MKATIGKNGGFLSSLIYRGLRYRQPRRLGAHAAGAPQVTNRITIDPATNGGERAEVSIKGVSGGRS